MNGYSENDIIKLLELMTDKQNRDCNRLIEKSQKIRDLELEIHEKIHEEEVKTLRINQLELEVQKRISDDQAHTLRINQLELDARTLKIHQLDLEASNSIIHQKELDTYTIKIHQLELELNTLRSRDEQSLTNRIRELETKVQARDQEINEIRQKNSQNSNAIIANAIAALNKNS